MLLKIENIRKYYPSKRAGLGRQKPPVKAVDCLDFSLAENEHMGLVGESGCGKTTLARILMKLIVPDEGKIIFAGQEISRFSPHEMRPFRRQMQMVFQDPFSSLDPRFTVRQILNEALIFEKLTVKEKEQRFDEMLKAVGLPSEAKERFPHEFSGGERQRIAIARALIMNPKLLILDEAVSALDVLVQQHIINLLESLRERFNMTYLFISHNLRVVKKICLKIAVMYKGKIVEYASTEEIFNNPLHPYTRKLLSAALHYKVEGPAGEIILPEKGRLIDRGKSHFVIE